MDKKEVGSAGSLNADLINKVPDLFYATGFLTGMLKGWSLMSSALSGAFTAAKSIAYYGRDGYPDATDWDVFCKRIAKGGSK